MANPFSQYHVAFGGSNEYVTMGNVPELNFASAAQFSVSFWTNFTGSAGSVFAGKMAGPTGYRGYLVYEASGKFNFLLSNDFTGGDYLRIETTLAYSGAWRHVALTWNGTVTLDASNAKFYVGGSLVSDSDLQDTLVGTASNSASFALGIRQGDLWGPLVGALDQPAVYDKELSPAEVSWIWNSGVPRDLTGGGAPSNLVGWWPIDGDTHPTLTDSSVSGNDGTMTNMETSDITFGAPGYQVPSVWTAKYQPLVTQVPRPDMLPSQDRGRYAPREAPIETVLDFMDRPSLRSPMYLSRDPATSPFIPPGGPTITRYFKMRAQDDGAAPPGYVTWISQNDPDFAGTGFAGGTPTPIGSMIPGSAVVVAEWEE
jgi:hypothetical protein